MRSEYEAAPSWLLYESLPDSPRELDTSSSELRDKAHSTDELPIDLLGLGSDEFIKFVGRD
jgi:hypothetical protein